MNIKQWKTQLLVQNIQPSKIETTAHILLWGDVMFSSMTEADLHKLAGDYETQLEDGIRKLLQFFYSNDFISYNFLVLFVFFFSF